MSLDPFIRLAMRVLPLVLTSPFFAGYGALVMLRGALRVCRRARALVTVFRRELRCPHGHVVPVTGRYACTSCRSEYLGHIAICRVCHEGADVTRCGECNVGVHLPWAER